ncbi:MAG TPA: alpha/beta hydrolase-fold protein [Gemmatimonadales bacterium]|jgi:enterochelin esterase family protein
MKLSARTIAIALCLSPAFAPNARGQYAARPQPAVAGLVAAFAQHPVVAIAEAHSLREAGDLYVALVRDPEFQRTVNDIVVEFASRQSQALLDRYVVAGDSVAEDTLRTIWRNTTKVAGWDSPVYTRWLTAIRDVNRKLPAGHRIRVLAGDTRVDWQALHTPADWAALGDNNVSFADVIINDVLKKRHKALVVLGSNHLMHGGSPRDGTPNTTSRVEAQFPGAMYVALEFTGWPGGDTTGMRIASERWPNRSIAAVAGTWLAPVLVGSNNYRFDALADGLLYLGPAEAFHREEMPPSYYDQAYITEVPRRSWIEFGDSARLAGLMPVGQVIEHQVPSRVLPRDRHVWVYIPPGYRMADSASTSLLIAFDGGVYTGDIPLPRILDSLITAKAIPSTVAVMIDNASGPERIADLGNRVPFATFVTDELVPWMRTHYGVTHAPERTVITGSSAGGLASAYIALRRPDIVGNVVSQSGAFWRGIDASDGPPFELITHQVTAAPRANIRFFLDVGSTESTGAMGGTAPSILDANRHLRSALISKGYAVTYFEVPGGAHAPDSWRKRLPIDLAAALRVR